MLKIEATGESVLLKNKPRTIRRRFVLAGVIIGVIAVALAAGFKIVLQPMPNLMERATWVAPLDKYSSYRWMSAHEVMLFQQQRTGTAAFQWDTASYALKPLGTGKRFEAMGKAQDSPLSVEQREGDLLVVKAWHNLHEYRQDITMPRPDHVWKLKVVPGTSPESGSCVASHDGRQVAYIAYMKPVNFWTPLRNRFWPEPIVGRIESGAVMVGDAEGANTRVVGYVKEFMPNPHSRYSKSGTTFSLQRLQWLPDDKRLSFAYGDGIYTLPVN